MKKIILHISIILVASAAFAQDVDMGKIITVPYETNTHETQYRVNSTGGITTPQKGQLVPGINFGDHIKARTGFDFMGKCAMYGTLAANQKVLKKDSSGNFVDANNLKVKDSSGKIFDIAGNEIVGGSISGDGKVVDSGGVEVNPGRRIAIDDYCNKF